MNWISQVMTGINYFVKIISVCEAAVDTYQTVQKEDKTGSDSARIITNVAFMTLQTFDVALPHAPISDSRLAGDVKIGVRCAAGVTDTLRVALNPKASKTDVFAKALFRTSDTIQGICLQEEILDKLRLSRFADAETRVKLTCLANGLENCAGIVSQRKNFVWSLNRLQSALQVIHSKIYPEKGNSESLPSTPASQTIKSQFLQPLDEVELEAAKADMEMQKFIEAPLSIKKIPKWIKQSLPHLPTCSITKQTIRFVVSPNIELSEDDDSEPAYYEKDELRKWLKDKPDEAPPNWPIDKLPLPLKMTDIRVNHDVQIIINRSLSGLAEDIDKLLNDPAQQV